MRAFRSRPITCRCGAIRSASRSSSFARRCPEEGYPDFIKRCIGVPGDHIKIVEGEVYVNGVRLKEPYTQHAFGSESTPVENFPPASIMMLDGGADPRVGRGISQSRGEWRTGGSAGRIFHDGRQSRQFQRQPLLGLRSAREHHRHAADDLYVDRRAESEEVWEPGHLGNDSELIASVFIHPSEFAGGACSIRCKIHAPALFRKRV